MQLIPALSIAACAGRKPRHQRQLALDVRQLGYPIVAMVACLCGACTSGGNRGPVGATQFLRHPPAATAAPAEAGSPDVESQITEVEARIEGATVRLDALAEAAIDMGLPTFFCGNDFEPMAEAERNYARLMAAYEMDGVVTPELVEAVTIHIEIQGILAHLELDSFVDERLSELTSELVGLLGDKGRLSAQRIR